MGGINKLLLPVNGPDGPRPMIAHVTRVVLAAGVRPVMVVVGSQATAEAVAGFAVACVRCPDPDEGLAASLRCGVAALPATVAGCLVCLGDMPAVTSRHIRAVAAAFDPAAGREVCAPVFVGRRWHPVAWGRRYFPELLRLSGDGGAQAVLSRHGFWPVSVTDDGVLVDVDTPEDAWRLL
ncbi:MAG: hypothetical protein FD149_1433 [Rhodospirillaceae bacterium]|nr:MAG: hypothetical protein FD149_1433 [Rhodospirillaceae bacterium]